MKEIQTSKGVLKYRMPNILEVYEMLESSGITMGESSDLKLKRNIIEAMASLVDFSDIEGCASYNDLLNDTEEMTVPLSEIANIIIEKVFGAFRKKS